MAAASFARMPQRAPPDMMEGACCTLRRRPPQWDEFDGTQHQDVRWTHFVLIQGLFRVGGRGGFVALRPVHSGRFGILSKTRDNALNTESLLAHLPR